MSQLVQHERLETTVPKVFFFPSFACGVLDISFFFLQQKNILTKGFRV